MWTVLHIPYEKIVSDNNIDIQTFKDTETALR